MGQGSVLSSAITCSMIGWARWRWSASMVSRVELVTNVWWRQSANSSPCMLPSEVRVCRRLTRRTTRRQVICWALGSEVNAVNGISATWASETHPPACSSKTACGYLIGVHASSLMAAMALTTCGFIRAVTENHAPARTAAAQNAEV